MTAKKKMPQLVVAGGRNREPTLDEIAAMVKQMTGKDPTPADLAEAKRILEEK